LKLGNLEFGAIRRIDTATLECPELLIFFRFSLS